MKHPFETTDVPVGFAGRATRIFLSNQKISLLTIGILIVWGTLSFALMPKQYNPEIVAPAFTITTELPGTSAEEVSTLLTKRVGDAVSGVPKVDDISSQSIAGGKSVVVVKFLVGYSEESATLAINQKLQDIQTTLPFGASTPLVQSIRPDDVPILDIALTSPTLSETSLRALAIDIADILKLVPGISSADILGGHTEQLKITLHADALTARNVTIADIENAIRKSNGSLSISELQNIGKNPFISIVGIIENPDDLSHISIREASDSILRLGDIADISLEPDDIREYVRISERYENASETVHITLSKLKGENATTVSTEALKKLEDLQKTLVPDTVKTSILRDEGATAHEEISKLSFDLVKSIVIVGALLALFLGLRNAFVASISIPLVLLAVFGMGLLAGQTINRITLFALILSLGLLVDDAIVVVENIARSFRLFPNENRIKLIVQAVDEVGGALALSTLTMALAFLPMAFVSGMMGPYMGPIPFFVPAALFASLIISVTLNPFLSLLSMPRKILADTEKDNLFVRTFKRIEKIYEQTLSALLMHRKKRVLVLVTTGAALIIALILPLTPLVPFRMLPKADKDHFSVYLDLPDGTALDTTDAATHAIETILLKDSDILQVESFVGTAPVVDFNGLFKGSSQRTTENQATLVVHLTASNSRSITSEAIAFRVRESLTDFHEAFPDAVARIIEDPPGPPVLSTFLLKVKGSNSEIREQIARDLANASANIDGVVDIDTSIPERGINPTYRINTEKASRLGVSLPDIEMSIQTAFSGSNMGLFHSTTRENPAKEPRYIVIRFAPENRSQEQDLSRIKISGKSGDLIPITDLLEPVNSPTEQAILSDNRLETTFISAEMGNRSIVYAVLDIFPTLLSYHLPDNAGERISWSPLGVTYQDRSTGEQYRVEIGGEWKLTIEVFRDLGIVMGVVLFLIFFVLAARTKSLIIPGLIMISIPLGLIGILPGFAFLQAVKGTYFNATSMIGVIALSGLSVKNAIIYLEYLEPLRHAGMPMREALVEAGRIRLLPIVLTSLAAILGSLTIVSDPVWEGLAWSIIFGLSASTFLTLIIFPLLYFIFERKHWEEKAS
ncbi:MAG: efflux RND transporter permease subunit [Candidatus Moraniibacteriota bacterium]|nr:MAG: efflux RND transporter permease subunit [Candidatus Moranbacteria bacterium]